MNENDNEDENMERVFKKIWPDAAAVVLFIVIGFVYFLSPVSDGLVLSGSDHTGAIGSGQGQAVASIESFWKEIPSEVSIEAVEPSVLKVFKKSDIQVFLEQHPESGITIAKFAYGRMINYYKLFLSRIKDSPEKRYQLLLEEHPEMVARIPQHYLASYLGITPVSLSRIRARK